MIYIKLAESGVDEQKGRNGEDGVNEEGNCEVGTRRNAQARNVPSVSLSLDFSSEMYVSVLGKFYVRRGQDVSDRSLV